MKVRFVEAEKAQHPVSLLCTAAGITPAGFYAARYRPVSSRQRHDDDLGGLISESYAQSRGTYAHRACTPIWPQLACGSAASASPG
jgi:putative transposase